MKLDQLLLERQPEQSEDKPFAAVAAVSDGRKWLLGLAKSEDDRKDMWVFPGGGIKRGEDPAKAAERECREETGIRCKADLRQITLPGKPGVIFFRCRKQGGVLKPNSEFAALGWFTRREMKALRVYKNVYKLLDKVTS